MQMKNAGNYDPDSKLKADIFITFKISDLEKYNLNILNDYDLSYEQKINIGEALTGYTLYLNDFPDGNKYALKINNIIKDNDIKYVKILGYQVMIIIQKVSYILNLIIFIQMKF